MSIIILCVAAYAILIASDFFALHRKRTPSRILFICGIVLWSFCNLFMIFTSDVILAFEQKPVYSIIMAALAGLSLSLLIYSLFFALPLKKTYVVLNNIELVDTGMYALCRHPGVIWLSLFHLFTWLFINNHALLVFGVVSVALDFIYTIIQDIFIFPKTINEYDEYKKKTPFIMPCAKGLEKTMKALWKKTV